MSDNLSGSAHKKRHSVFGRLKNVLTGQSKDSENPLTAPEPSVLETSTKPDTKGGLVDPKN
ncbi:hypothetical protein BJY01DRAFT_223940 [Aspergillus pseudoustus]|uniref:Uncharacterized protein n=1 Tax=Aspergillus pseudoustus TaxID=1810923 RepID=A0ABR4J458_9EURO